MTTSELLALLLGATIVLLNIAYITTQNDVATGGAEYAATEQKIADLKRENVYLHAKIEEAAALTTLSREASASGFITAPDPIWLH